MSKLETNQVDPASGTTLTLGTSGDTVTVPTGVGLTATDEVKSNKLSPATGTALQIGDSGDTITIPSGATIVNSGTQTGFGGTNTPAFLASSTGEVTVANNSNTLINNYSVEILDTDSCYNTSNSRFTPTTAGYYQIFAIVGSYPSYTANNFNTILAKNGVTYAYTSSYSTQYPQQETVGMTYLNGSGDYVEVYCYQDSGSSRQVDGGTHRIFGGFKIIQ